MAFRDYNSSDKAKNYKLFHYKLFQWTREIKNNSTVLNQFRKHF